MKHKIKKKVSKLKSKDAVQHHSRAIIPNYSNFFK